MITNESLLVAKYLYSTNILKARLGFRKYQILASYSSRGPSKFNQISDGPHNGVKTTAPDMDEFTITI